MSRKHILKDKKADAVDMDGVVQRHISKIYGRALFERLCEQIKQVGKERIAVDGELISYVPDEMGRVGMYVAANPLTPEHNYFEIEVVDPGVDSSIVVGLVSAKHPLDKYPGWLMYSVGFHIGEGNLYRETPEGTAFGPVCETGDHIGIGIKFENLPSRNKHRPTHSAVFFTYNGKEFGSTICSSVSGALYPAVGFHSMGEEVRLSLDLRWTPEEDMSMCIDSNEEEWSRLHDIKLNGTILEYVGRGKSIIDVGLAQSKYPLDTTHHYYEIEIVDPGESCYIAIGLARKDYPTYRHPGWNKGSIAYHADDGKIFIGSGVGDPFGPRCHKGDIMGCGIIFPRDFVSLFDSDVMWEGNTQLEYDDEFCGSFSESEDEEWWNVQTDIAVQVFFTRNGKTIGQKDICIPRGGFYPTIGMLSSDEKVKVDLHPLTG